MVNDSLRKAIREDPDRFMVDMDLQKIFDKITFDREIDRAINRTRGHYRKQAAKWTEESDYLYGQDRVRDIIYSNIERDFVYTGRKTSSGTRVKVRGHDNADGTYTLVRMRTLRGGRRVRFLQTRRKAA